MTKSKTAFTAIIVAIVTVVLLALAASGAGEGKMTIKRVDDPVTVQGKEIKRLSGKPISKMRLLIWKGGKFVPAPYQIDERFPSGDWVFPIATPPEKDVDSGLVDDNDELAFMAHDMGDEAPAGSKPTGAKAGVKISVRDPVDGGVGYAYLFLFDNPPAPSKVDYATYKVGKEWMWMIGSTYKLATRLNDSYFDKCMLKRPDGSWGPDIMDRYKTRGRGISIPGTSQIPESKAKAKAVGWIDGPVRVLRKSIGWLKIAWKIKIQGKGSSQNIYYPSFFVVPLTLQIPPIPKAFIRNLHLDQTLDFTRKFWGSKYYDQVNTAGVKFDGKMSEAEKNLNLTKNRLWYCITGPAGTVFVRYVYPKVMTDTFSPQGYYVDDTGAADSPEEEPGQSNVGIYMKGIGNLKPGTYLYNGYFYFPKNFKWDNRRRVLNMVDKPLSKKVEPVE